MLFDAFDVVEIFLHPQHLNLKKIHGAEATLVLLRGALTKQGWKNPLAPPVAGLCEGLQPELPSAQRS